MTEIWRPVLGWEDRYEVSNEGRVRSLCHRGKPRKEPWIVSLNLSNNGYLRAHLMRDRKLSVYGVHCLVAEAFIGPRPEGNDCRHLDGNPMNNKAVNLAWGTKQENMRDRDDHGRTYRGETQHLAVFTEDEIRAMRLRYAQGERRPDIVRDIVATKGCDPTVVRDILGFRTWKHVK